MKKNEDLKIKQGAIILTIFALALMVSPCTADIVDPNTGVYHNMYRDVYVERCYVVENAGDYSGYVFGVAPYPDESGGFVAFGDNPCFLVETDSPVSRVYAMQEEDYSRLKQQNPGHIPFNTAISSGYTAPARSSGYVMYNRPANETDLLTVISLDKSRVTLCRKESYTTGYNGQREDLPDTKRSRAATLSCPLPTGITTQVPATSVPKKTILVISHTTKAPGFASLLAGAALTVVVVIMAGAGRKKE